MLGKILLLGVVPLLLTTPCPAVDNSVEKKIEQPVDQALTMRRKQHQDEVAWRQEKQNKTARYEQLQAEFATLQERQKQLLMEHESLQQRVVDKTDELAQIAQIEEQLRPFLTEIVSRLQAFCGTDLPFLHAEREQRLTRLQELLGDTELPLNEQLRKVMEALMVEADYGRSIEVTRETIPLHGEQVLVNQFRLGRLGLYFQTLDESCCGFYDMAAEQWQELPATYSGTIRTALEIGAKRRPAELVSLPLGRLAMP